MIVLKTNQFQNEIKSISKRNQINFKTNKTNKTSYIHELKLGAYVKATTQSAARPLLILKYF